MILVASAMLLSCLGSSDNDVTEYSDTAITAVTLGTLNRYIHSTSANTGNDTIVKSTLAGSTYKITIDQLNHKIYNQDSLPVGTDLKHVTLSTLNTKNSGVASIKSLISDTLFYISTTDSLDFSQPRTLRVIATNGIDYRDYTMTLAASITTGTTFGWKLVGKNEKYGGWNDCQFVTIGDTVFIVNRGTVAVNVPKYGKKVLMRVEGDGYLEWADPTTGGDSLWTKYTEEKQPVVQLIGATNKELFALGINGGLMVCNDVDKMVWRDEMLDESSTLLPTSGIAMVSWDYTPVDSTDYVLMVGNSEQDEVNASIWRKLSRYHATGEDTEGTWVYMPVDGSNHYALPRQDNLSLAYYDNSVLAVGSDMKILRSRDQGITWKSTNAYTLPTNVEGTKAIITADKKGRLWLLTDAGQLWEGTLR
jgi:hypothetical protein